MTFWPRKECCEGGNVLKALAQESMENSPSYAAHRSCLGFSFEFRIRWGHSLKLFQTFSVVPMGWNRIKKKRRRRREREKERNSMSYLINTHCKWHEKSPAFSPAHGLEPMSLTCFHTENEACAHCCGSLRWMCGFWGKGMIPLL